MKRLCLLAFFLFAFGLASCSSLPGSPGYISEDSQREDGLGALRMEPAWAGNRMKLGLGWHPSLPENTLLLTAVVRGAKTFAPEESLVFVVDGKESAFRSIDAGGGRIDSREGAAFPTGYVPASNWTSNTYLVPRSFVRGLVASSESEVRVRLRDAHLTGDFSQGGATRARPAFRRFLEKVGEAQ